MINLFLSQNENFKLVRVTFPSSQKRYTYKSILNVEVGDKVIVDSPRDGLTIVDVVEVIPGIESELTFTFDLKWVVQKVNTSHYEEAKEMERKLVAELNKIKAAKARRELLADAELALGSEATDKLAKLVRL